MASDVGSTVNDTVAHEHPQSCLALVAKLWQLETEMTQRIRHAAEWPQVVIPDWTEAGYKPQRVKFTGRTQTRMESLLTEAATWKTELEQLKQTVRPMFSELQLPKPDGSEFQIR